MNFILFLFVFILSINNVVECLQYRFDLPTSSGRRH